MIPRWRWCRALEEAGGLEPSLWTWVEHGDDLPSGDPPGALLLAASCGSAPELARRYAGRQLRMLTFPGTPRQRCQLYGGEFSPGHDQWMLLVGNPVGPNRWEQRPLYGQCLWLTRHPDQLQPLQARLEELGAEVVSFPVLEFLPPDDPEPLQQCLGQLEVYDWILFTSPNGVERFFRALWEAGGDPRRLSRSKIAVIGPGTARALQERGLRADLIPERSIAEGLLESFEAERVAGQRFLLARAQEAREILPEQLRARGARVEVVACYRTDLPPSVSLPGSRPDWVVLMSASAARHFRQLYPQAELPPALCIGPVTAEEAAKLGYPRLEVAQRYNLDGIVDRLLQVVAPQPQ